VGRHHAEGLPHAQVKGAAHALGDVPAEGALATRQRAPGLRLAFLTSWQTSRAAARNSSNSCCEEL
jgi:hypothetical protein